MAEDGTNAVGNDLDLFREGKSGVRPELVVK